MPHDPALIAETRAWVWKAAEDLRAGEFELKAVPPLSADIVFHAQQAAEKAMKGFLTWHGRPFRKTHNLIEIGETCASIDGTLEPRLRRAAELSEYAWKFRYPGEPEEPTRAEAEKALHHPPLRCHCIGTSCSFAESNRSIPRDRINRSTVHVIRLSSHMD